MLTLEIITQSPTLSFQLVAIKFALSQSSAEDVKVLSQLDLQVASVKNIGTDV